MKQNVGAADRAIRAAVGLAIGAAGLRFHSWLGLFGLAPLATALVGWCPGYLPFAISTCAQHSERS